jgi:uncharacterized membrane protein
MNNLVRFTVVVLIVFVAILLTLAVAGVMSSKELWNNMATIAKLVAIFFGASALIMLVANKK